MGVSEPVARHGVALPQFECDGCGACCRTFPIFAAAAHAQREPRIAAEGRALPAWLSSADWAYQLFPLPFHQSCCFLGPDERCTISASRPAVCRTFAAGSPQCQEARARHGLPPLQAAPGLLFAGRRS
jgi:Fe-S-cluster containining protein